MQELRSHVRLNIFRSENSLCSNSSPQKTFKRTRFGAVLLAALFLPILVSAQTLPDKPTGYVTDAANVLSAETKSSLEVELAALDASTTEQIAVVTVPSMDGDYIEHYAAQLFQKWGIGQAKQDNGVLLVLAIEERKLRIEVGYGLEGALPDSVANAIIQNDMVPHLKQGDYDGAVTAGVASIVAAVQGEYTAPTVAAASRVDPFAMIFFGLIALQWLTAIVGRSKSWWLGGVVGGIGGVIASTVLGWWVFAGLGLTCALIFAGLLFDYVVSNATTMAKQSGSANPWWSGGGGFGGSSRGGGFGGFGGGMSGGGGASGSW